MNFQKHYGSLLAIVLITISCQQQIKEAAEARKKSDSILNEFKKVNASLDSTIHNSPDTGIGAIKNPDSFLIDTGK